MRLGIVALVVLSSCAPVLAQSNFATLSGAVEDPQGGPVTGAALSLKSTATGESRNAAVNSAGLFEIAGLKPGTYQLEVRASGFADVERTVIRRSIFICFVMPVLSACAQPFPLA